MKKRPRTNSALLENFVTREVHEEAVARIKALEEWAGASRLTLNKIEGILAVTQADVNDTRKDIHQIKNMLGRVLKGVKKGK